MTKHVFGILVALAVGFVFGLPHLVIPRLQPEGTWYTPLTTKTTFKTDESVYAAEAKEVAEGHVIPRDAYVYERAALPTPRVVGSAGMNLVLGGMTVLTNSVVRTFIIGSFLFPSLGAFLVYLLLQRATSRPYLSATAAATTLIAVHLLNINTVFVSGWLASLRESITHPAEPMAEFNVFARAPVIQFTFMLFMATLWAWCEAIERPSRAMVYTAGVALGLTFYTYFFYWTFFLTGGVILLAMLLLAGRRDAAFATLKILGVGLLVAVPWFIIVLASRFGPNASDFAARLGMEYGRESDPQTRRYIEIAVVCLFVGFLNRKRTEPFVFGALLLGGVVCINAQVLLGFTIQPYHWTRRVMDPLVVIVIAYVLARLLSVCFDPTSMNLRRLRRSLGAVVAALVVALWVNYGVAESVSYSRSTAPNQMLPWSTREAYGWLDRQTALDDVVISLSLENTILVPVYTRNKVFLPVAWETGIPEAEVWDRLFVAARLYDLPVEFFQKRLDEHDPYIPWVGVLSSTKKPDLDGYESAFFNLTLFGGQYRFWAKYLPNNYDYSPAFIKEVMAGGRYFYFPPKVRRRVIAEFEAYPRDVSQLITKYRIDYLYWGPFERSVAGLNPSTARWLEQVYKGGDVEIYRVKRPPQ